MSETKEVTLTPDRDVLMAHRNSFQKQLIDNVLDYRRHVKIKEVDPQYQRQNQQGKFVGIDELIENYRKGAANAKSYVVIIDELLSAEKDGTLAEAWATIENIPTPFGGGASSEESESEKGK